MTDKACIQWLFEEFMKEHVRADKAEEELRFIKAPLQITISQEALKRRHRGGPKRKGQ